MNVLGFASFWGAHAPRVLIAAPRRNRLQAHSPLRGIKFAMARAPLPAREARALPKP